MKDLEKIITEDMVNMNSSPASPGYGWMSRKLPLHMSVLDILKMDQGDLDKAKAVLPHQATPLFDMLIFTMDDGMTIKREFKKILEHPLIKNDKEKKEVIKKSMERLTKIIEVYKKIMHDLGELRLE